MIEPIRLGLDLACPPDHAFAVWTGRISQWWPADHTVTADPDLTIVLEGRPGGRIFERTADGIEHDWGEVTVWEPPRRLVYLWHLRRDRSEATEVEIRFPGSGKRDSRQVTTRKNIDKPIKPGKTYRRVFVATRISTRLLDEDGVG